MTERQLLRAFEREVDGVLHELMLTALEAFDAALANVEPPFKVAGVHLHQIQWHNGEPMAVRLYVERATGEGVQVDDH